MQEVYVVLITKQEVVEFNKIIFGNTKVYDFAKTKHKLIRFFEKNRPESISKCNWEDISYTARYELMLKEQKKQLIIQQQELFNRLKAEVENSYTNADIDL